MKKRGPRHHLSKTPEYKIWKGIRKRCFCPKAANNGSYQGKGITMCDGFKRSVRHFVSTVGKRPEGYEIDRIDNDGHYSCGECDHCKEQGWTMNLRWTTHKENCKNKGNNRFITFQGKTQTIGEWQDETGIHHMVIHRRIRSGWSVKRALTVPPDGIENQPKTLPESLFETVATLYSEGKSLGYVAKKVGFGREAVKKCLVKQDIEIRTLSEQRKLSPTTSHNITFNGETKPATEWAEELGIAVATLTKRLRKGWSVEEALTTPLRQW